MSAEIAAALIALAGVAVIAVVQWVATRATVRAEAERLHYQLRADFHREHFAEWQSKFHDAIVDLLAATDPEINPQAEKAKVIPLVLRAQLMLNPQLPTHARVNSVINRLALVVNDWEAATPSGLLGLHSELLEASRNAMYLPGKGDVARLLTMVPGKNDGGSEM